MLKTLEYFWIVECAQKLHNLITTNKLKTAKRYLLKQCFLWRFDDHSDCSWNNNSIARNEELFNHSVSEVRMEVANFIERKNTHPHVYCVKDLSVIFIRSSLFSRVKNAQFNLWTKNKFSVNKNPQKSLSTKLSITNSLRKN